MAVLGLCASCAAGATDLVYTPVNPNFGGNPLNGTMLKNIADAINEFEKPPTTAVEKFNQNLQTAILSKLSTQILSSMFSGNANLQPGTYETVGFLLTITDIGNGQLTIETVDKTTGETASFTIAKVTP
jgi:curli production assembly/transport component CsgF